MFHGWNGNGFFQGGYAFGFPWGGVAMGVVFLGIAVLLAVAIVRFGKNEKRDDKHSVEHGVDLLVERFVRGEIDADMFRAMKSEIDSGK